MRNMFVFLIVCATIGCGISELGFHSATRAHAAQTDPLPGWVLSELKKYPLQTYLFEVGKRPGTDKKAFENAVADARERAATRILWKVEHIIRSNDSVQYDMVREHYSAVLEHYCLESQMSPALQLGGLNERNLSVDAARTDSHTYALVYIRRDTLKELYAKHEQKLHREINRILENARNYENTFLDIKSAAATYLRTYPLYEALKEAEIVQIGAEYAPNYSEALRRLEHSAIETRGGGSLIMSQRQVIKRVKEIDPGPIVTNDDIARLTAIQIGTQWGSPVSASVQLEPLTYKHEGLICHFSKDFSIALQKQLGWHFVSREDYLIRKNISDDGMHQKTWVRSSGSFWENGDEITIRITMRDLHTGEFQASSVISFLNSQLREPITLTPANYNNKFIENQRAFSPQYILPDGSTESPFSPVGGIEVEIWTDKGRDPVYYVKGETMKVYGRVNQPAYLRLLYILADDRKYLLLDNYHIKPAEVNSDVEIGEFVCAPPFGAEILVVAARTEMFPPIETYTEKGFDFLVDQDPESASRAMRLKTDEVATDFQHNEAKVVIVTQEK